MAAYFGHGSTEYGLTALFSKLNWLKLSQKRENGYGADAVPNPLLQLWARFYNQGADGSHYFPSYDEAEAEFESGQSQKFVFFLAICIMSPWNYRFIKLRGSCYFNLEVFKKRIEIPIKTFLHEADSSARYCGPYSHIARFHWFHVTDSRARWHTVTLWD